MIKKKKLLAEESSGQVLSVEERYLIKFMTCVTEVSVA